MAAVQPHTKDAPSTIDFRVEGMTCGSCAARVQRVLAKTDGVADAEVNLATGRAHLTLQRPLPTADLQARVARIGYGLTPLAETPGGGDDLEERARRSWRRRVWLVAPAAVFAVATMLAGPALMEDPGWRLALFAVATLVQFGIGWPFLREAARRARRGTANMDTLIAVGTLAAYGFSVVQLLTGGMELYFETAILLIAFLTLGRWFEARARGRAGQAIRALLELGAKQARVVRDGAEVLVPVEQVTVGDLLRIRPGEKVPVHALGGDHVGQGHLAAGQGAGLVEHHRGDAAGSLQDLDAPDQDAELGAAAGADHDGGRGGQPERARAGDDQHCHRRGQPPGRVAAQQRPAGEGQRGHGHHQRDEHRRDAVGQALQLALAGLGLLDQLDDLGQGSVGPDRSRLHRQHPASIDRGAGHPVTGGLVDR